MSDLLTLSPVSLSQDSPSDPAPRLLPLDSLLCLLEDDARLRNEARRSGEPLGPITGLPGFDKAIGGALSQGIHVLHGAPGTGKSALALQIAATCGCPALFVTCEMVPIELLKRVTARVTGTYLGRLSSGEWLPRKINSLAQQTVATVPDLVILDATSTFASPAQIGAAARSVRQQSAHLLIVVDSLHAWAGRMPTSANEYDKLNLGLDSLGQIANQQKCPVLLICERNRNQMSVGGQSAGAGTRKIEYAAETVIELDAGDNEYDDDGSKSVNLTLSKNRHGRTGTTVNLVFNGPVQRFEEE